MQIGRDRPRYEPEDFELVPQKMYTNLWSYIAAWRSGEIRQAKIYTTILDGSLYMIQLYMTTYSCTLCCCWGVKSSLFIMFEVGCWILTNLSFYEKSLFVAYAAAAVVAYNIRLRIG